MLSYLFHHDETPSTYERVFDVIKQTTNASYKARHCGHETTKNENKAQLDQAVTDIEKRRSQEERVTLNFHA